MNQELLEAQKPAVIYTNGGIGDHLLTLPALRALTTLFPERLTLICLPNARQMCFPDLGLHAVCEMSMNLSGGNRVFDARALAESIRGCDLLLSLNPGYSPSLDLLLDLLTPARSVGFFSPHQIVVPLDFSKHYAELAFSIPLQLSSMLQVEHFALPPLYAAEYRQQAQLLRSKVPAPIQVLAVHAETKAEKMWSVDRLEKLLKHFLSRHPEFVVFVLGRENLNLDVGEHNEQVIPCGGLPFAVSLSLLASVDLFLGVDSCMLHGADLFY